MKYNTFLHLAFFILSMWLEITTAIKIGAGNYTCIEKERDALLHLKSHIHHDPHGVLSNWTRDDEANNDCCRWSGVECDNQTGHVRGLGLSGGFLEGKISHSLLNLSYLNYLDLSFNSFSGTIPMFIGSMSHLRYLDLSANYFSGTIPMFIGSMSHLRYLDLSDNYFSGTIPMFIGSMSHLRYLGLGANDFSGIFPSELGNLTNLQSLYLQSLGNCTVENLDWVSRLSQLESIYMGGTSLAKVDNWVDVILSLQKLSELSLQECDLSRVINPYSHSSISVNSSFSPSIVELYIGNNNLNSSMYQWLFPLVGANLEILDLSGNKLDVIPRYLGNLCSLGYLDLSNNSIAIKFSDFINNLSGCTSVFLNELHAAGNQLTGLLSDDIRKFQSLRHLDLSYNELEGSISEEIWKLTKLRYLDISSNSLNGTISKNVGKSNLSKANMSNHSNVEWLDFSKNRLNGGISFLCQFVNGSLIFLDISNNLLSGEIPDCLWHFKELRVLNLGQNNLFGRLPSSIKYLINLEVLNLYNNCFSGELPSSLKNCTNLTFLQLGVNKFSGYVPAWIGETLTGLYALSLTSNKFFGTIPSQLCHLKNLRILDFSVNNLHGTVPLCLNNFSAMVQDDPSYNANLHTLPNIESVIITYLDHAMIEWQGSTREFSTTLGLVKSINLSHNNLTGKIPNELTDLNGLISLNLSINALQGEIPTKIGLMKHLLHLDLSRNHLSGRMPASMSQMTSLEYLDVSYNYLSGTIPSSTQLQSFEPSRYTGNAGLCGLPLTNFCHGDKELEDPPVINESENDVQEKDELDRYFFIGGAVGFSIGFWAICIGLLLYHRGRRTFFEFMNNLEDWVYVKVMVFIAKC